ncbi:MULTISPECIES: pyrroloquinoline quinone biosynthesis protein PqqF [Pseudomonas]|uniref:Coenzyme PQQ synthesis protein F n=1 Tax=Pseudomonas aphyarum TaxID=2942629 RepID=A0ABT5PUI7_9PSED|nr:pyrroloquinoline quinone biosynthesis protein PqqF [Pseudomonas aphyarum]MDD0967085.1 pyrroloquinoline quinone biosynthesis protein PqqF [Pseudomonas aphyarum]MDD1127430.1 pyrroloquinoline quinone biosynthesis protein PqqF [Pseudomonas aphyarum]
MPAPTHPRPHTETLANGLRVTLRHVPGLKRSAAALRVAAGSHDVPLAWPGLAHFLEHLLFLGTERFPASQGLMAYVQGHGGQVNASTRERTTDFFFELPPASFSGGLERLSDMLARPRMSPDDQLREREVLQAEFVAWSQDAAAQQKEALFEGLSAAHPLRGFHAGSRESLPVELADFQQALEDFHQQFYRTGQMILSLVGPQSVEELRTLAEQFAATLTPGDKTAQADPVRLMDNAKESYQQAGERHGNLLFALEDLPEFSAEALAFLCHWLNSAKPRGLLTHLRQLGLVESLQACVPYQFTGQALLHLQFTAESGSLDAIRAQFFDWLSFFAAQQDWPALRQEYATLLERQQQVSGALQLARLDSEQLENEISESSVAALKEILGKIGTVDNFSSHWHLPTANPFLRSAEPLANAGLIRGQTSAHRGLRTFAQDRSRSRRERSPMQFSQTQPDNGDEGAVYVRWQTEAAATAELQAKLQRSLREVSDDARQAGVELSFSTSGNQWLLKLIGLQDTLPVVLEHALKSLTQVGVDSAKGEPQPALIPIRQLLKVLPEQCLPAVSESDDAAHLWTTSRWDGLALGLSPHTQSAMGLALSRIPGIPDNQIPPPSAIHAGFQWSQIDSASSEHALLLFCPTASHEIADEAAWRLLAHLCQSPFYQRLRVELQLGYAVFSGLRQLHGQTGLLFGVQSPTATAAQLLGHIQKFLDGLPALVEQLDDASLNQQRQTLADQFYDSALSCKDAAELLWQARLPGHSSDYLAQLRGAIAQLDRPALLAAAQRLIRAEGGWHGLANSPSPGAPWQAAK